MHGAVWASELQHEKIKNGDEFAYRTDFGWVLFGKSPESQQQGDARVSFVKAALEVVRKESATKKTIVWKAPKRRRRQEVTGVSVSWCRRWLFRTILSGA